MAFVCFVIEKYFPSLRYFHWEMCSWMWSTLTIIYLSNCPLNARYYEFTVGMSLVSVTVSSMSNVLSDYRINLEPGITNTVFEKYPKKECVWVSVHC